ncbi:MAG TPA: universal stress protein [Noviherbaspirillum sp.]|nr:universal stress protein [Noviherbaspirillum sp.]
MSYKTILVFADESRHAQKRFEIAARLALQEDAHLAGVAATAMPGAFYLPEMIGESTMSLTAYLEYLRQRADGVLAQFEGTARNAGVPGYERRVVDDEAASALCLQARYADLVVIGQTDPDEQLPALRQGFPEYVVLNAARPVLVIPYAGDFPQIGKRIVVAWDASTEATRAITAALPFLRRADVVQVTVFDAGARGLTHGEQPGADIALFLSRHGVKVEVSQQVTADRIDVGNALLSAAADFNADMMVMGCYGHSRFREVLLGGVSNTIFRSMTVPVLMCH